MKIPFLNFSPMHAPLKSSMMKAFEAVYDSNWFILGDQVLRFEKEFAAFHQTKFALGVSNGLDALHIALKALNVGEGDEVIVPSNTYIATALAVSYVGAKPVFIEPKKDTYNIDPELIESALTPKTKAIMPVHLYGQACEMDSIMSIAKAHKLYVIEDNAQSIGATWKGQMTATFGDMNATSFYPGKNLGALGDAGGITTSTDSLFENASMLRNYGSIKKYVHDRIGFNMRMDELQAAFLTIKLGSLGQWTIERQAIAKWYNNKLKNIPGIVTPYVHPDATHVYHLYVIRCEERNALQAHLSERGIGTLIHYPIPPHLQNAYAHMGYAMGDFPIAEELANTSLSLPLWPGMTELIVDEVCSAIKEFVQSKSH